MHTLGTWQGVAGFCHTWHVQGCGILPEKNMHSIGLANQPSPHLLPFCKLHNVLFPTHPWPNTKRYTFTVWVDPHTDNATQTVLLSAPNCMQLNTTTTRTQRSPTTHALPVVRAYTALV